MNGVLYVSMVVGVLGSALPASGQAPAGALAIDERQGDQWGWAVDYETAEAARARALRECGGGCSVVLTFARCGAYAADQDADSTAVGWAESYESAAGARQAALSECRARGGGSGCVVRAWAATGRWWRRVWVSTGRRGDRYSSGCGQADSTRGERTGCSARGRVLRSGAGRRRGGRVRRGIWTSAAAEALRTSGESGPAVAQVARPGPTVTTAAQPPAVTGQRWVAAGSGGVRARVLAIDREQHEPGGVRGVSATFPERGVHRAGAGAAGGAAISGRHTAGGVRPACRRRDVRRGASGGGRVDVRWCLGRRGRGRGDGGRRRRGPASGAGVPRLRGLSGDVVVPAGSFRMGCVSGQDCLDDEFPVHEVRVPSFALGRYEVLFEEYDRFVAATRRESPDDAGWGRGGRPVINVSWRTRRRTRSGCRRRRGNGTGCRARRSGSMRRERGRRRRTVGCEIGQNRRIATAAAASGTMNRRRRRVRSPRTRGACTTCTATCMCGWRTAGTTATARGRQRTARRGRAAGTAIGACGVAVPVRPPEFLRSASRFQARRRGPRRRRRFPSGEDAHPLSLYLL